MDNRETKATPGARGLALQEICDKIERIFPGTVCAYAGFVRPRVPTEDEDIVIEVFFAPAGSARPIARATWEDTRRIWGEHGVSVAIVTHDEADTLRYYAGDVLAIYFSRQVSSLLDPGGFCGQTVSIGGYWTGFASCGGFRSQGETVLVNDRGAMSSCDSVWHERQNYVAIVIDACESSAGGCHV